MRIIKLSNDDRDFNEDKDVANYFEIKLLNRNGWGQTYTGCPRIPYIEACMLK